VINNSVALLRASSIALLVQLGIDPELVSETARPKVEDVLDWHATNPGPLRSRQETMAVFRVSLTTLQRFERAGDLETFHAGRKTMITTASIVRRMIRQIIATYPVGAPAPVREGPPRSRKRRVRRAPPSEAQLRGFREANARRHREKQEREGEAVS
jgi:hypothetical protein